MKRKINYNQFVINGNNIWMELMDNSQNQKLFLQLLNFCKKIVNGSIVMDKILPEDIIMNEFKKLMHIFCLLKIDMTIFKL